MEGQEQRWPVYIASDGQAKVIAHMSYPHLVRSLEKLERSDPSREREIRDMAAERDLRRTGYEAARAAAGIAADASWKDDPPEIMAKLSARLDAQ